MIAAAALWALAAPVPPVSRPVRLGERIDVVARILQAVEVRGGRTDARHQRRQGLSPERTALTLLEFE